LLIGERAHLLPVDEDGADQVIVLEHWHADCGSCPAELGRQTDSSIFGSISSVNDLFRTHGTIEQATWCRSSQQASPLSFGQFRRRTNFCGYVERLTVETE